MKTNYPFSRGAKHKMGQDKQMITKPKNYTGENKQKNNSKINKKPKKSSSISNLVTKNHRFPKNIYANQIGKNAHTDNIDTNNSLDILNFSKIDVSLNKLKMSNSYSDIFDTKNSNDRYKDIDTPLNTSLMDKKANNKKVEALNQTPSTICNYYQQSEQSTAKKKILLKSDDNENLSNGRIKINLNNLYNNMQVKEGKPKNSKLIKVNRNKNMSTVRKHTNSSIISSNNSNSNHNTNLLLKNYLNSKLYENSTSKKINKCKTTSVDIQKNSSVSKNIISKHHTQSNLINTTAKKKQVRRSSQQKPIMLYLDQMKYEAYFITPNSKRIKKNMTNVKQQKKEDKKTFSAKSTMPSSYSSIKMKNGMLKNNSSNNKINNNSNNNNYLKISKTLTEQNIINIIQNTPKTNKISFLSSLSTVTKNNMYKNSNAHMTMIKVTKAKTQSALKSKNCSLIFNNNQGTINNSNEKDVKQKLLDRMNKAMKNNWNYLYKNKAEDKRKLMENISALIQTPNKEKTTFGFNNITGEKMNFNNDDDDFFDC